MSEFKFNPHRILPFDKVIKLAGYHLYRIGLTEQKYAPFVEGQSVKRKLYYKHKFIIIILLLSLISYSISLFIDRRNKKLLLHLGIWPAFIPGIRYHISFAMVIYTTSTLIIKFVYCYNDKNVNKNFKSWMEPFAVLSGHWPPARIFCKLDNECDVDKLILQTGIVFQCVQISR